MAEVSKPSSKLSKTQVSRPLRRVVIEKKGVQHSSDEFIINERAVRNVLDTAQAVAFNTSARAQERYWEEAR